MSYHVRNIKIELWLGNDENKSSWRVVKIFPSILSLLFLVLIKNKLWLNSDSVFNMHQNICLFQYTSYLNIFCRQITVDMLCSFKETVIRKKIRCVFLVMNMGHINLSYPLSFIFNFCFYIQCPLIAIGPFGFEPPSNDQI